NSAYLGATQSGTVLFATFIGGTTHFFGPVLGAIIVTYLQLGLTNITTVWQLYFGIIFIGIVMFAPRGVAGLIMMHRPLIRGRTLGTVIPAYLIAAIPTLAFVLGVILTIETVARYTDSEGEGNLINLFGAPFDATSPTTWLVAAVLVVGGFFVARMTWKRIAEAWNRAATVAGERGYLA
ncbi:MAG: branched-chain amino acid ABC transporter permease, partial [Bradyrhizobium sp.]